MSKFFKKNNSLKYLVLLCCLFFLISCLEDRPAKRSENYTLPNSWFDGVTKVRNLGGYPGAVEVSWNSIPLTAQKYKIYSVIKNSDNTVGYSLISEEPGGATSFIHRDSTALTSGKVVTYRVTAVNFAGVEDPNVLQKSTVIFEGISRVVILNKTQARVVINTTGSFDKMKITATPSREVSSLATDVTVTQNSVIKDFTSASTDFVIEGLRPGTEYQFHAGIDFSGSADGNTVFAKAATPSETFGSGSDLESLSDYNFRNVILVQAFGDAPNVLNTTTAASTSIPMPSDLTESTNPSKRIIKVVPNKFGGDASAKYRIIRVAGVGNTVGTVMPPNSEFNTSTNVICEPPKNGNTATAQACVICDHSAVAAGQRDVASGDCDLSLGSSSSVFTDQALDPAPKKYFYTITKVARYSVNSNIINWPEQLPDNSNYSQFVFAAHVPDDYMVLLQRESVNYDMCSLMKKTPNPKKNNSCAYNGIAAAPKTTLGGSISTEIGTYDFGYNLLVDRYALSCNWSRPKYSGHTPCGKGYGCFGISANNLEYGKNDNPIASSEAYSLPASSLSNPGPLSFNFNEAYSLNPLSYYSLQNKGNNCYAGFLDEATIGAAGETGIDSVHNTRWTSIGRLAQLANDLDTTKITTRQFLTNIVRSVATSDPGPLGSNYSDRKRPAITGLTNTQAQALCKLQNNKYAGRKRLLRRREYIAASSFPSYVGDPGYTSPDNINRIINGIDGNTLYNWQSSSTQKFGAGTSATLGSNYGNCAAQNFIGKVFTNPNYCDDYDAELTLCTRSYNPVVNPLDINYCANSSGCTSGGRGDFKHRDNNFGGSSMIDGRGYYLDTQASLTGNPNTNILDNFLDPRNESTQITLPGSHQENHNSAPFYIGSLATNKCLTRYGNQDMIGSSNPSQHINYLTTSGFYLSDQFLQTKPPVAGIVTNPVFVPYENSFDVGVISDYKYDNDSTNIIFSKNITAT